MKDITTKITQSEWNKGKCKECLRYREVPTIENNGNGVTIGTTSYCTVDHELYPNKRCSEFTTTEPQQGEWVLVNTSIFAGSVSIKERCTLCRRTVVREQKNPYNYCPNCGSKMKNT